MHANAGRPDKPAFVDDVSTLSFAQLDDKARRLAAGLRALGVKREERVFLLMLDGTDWPIAFLGAIYAGVVPVAVNTLLTADDYAYMLEHSRAQAVLVSGALRGTLKMALTKSDHEAHKVIVSHPDAPLEPNEVEFDAFVGAHAPLEKPAATHADDPAFWLYSSGSTGRPKGVVHTQANPYWAAELYGRNTLQVRESDVCFSAAKLFFAYGLGNALTFPLTVGATTLLMSERPTPDAVFKRWLGGVAGLKPTIFFGAPTGYAGMLAAPNLPAREEVALRLTSSAGEALPAEIGQRFQRHFGIDIVDGIGSTEMLHIFLSNLPDKVRYGTTGWPVPGYEIELRGDNPAGRCRTANRATSTFTAPRQRRCIGATAPKPRRPFRAAGPNPATNTSATRTAPIPMPDAPTTCSRSVVSMSARSRSRRRWCSTPRYWKPPWSASSTKTGSLSRKPM